MTEVIGVRFKKVGKVYYFDPKGIQVQKDQPVIVETARGLEYGEVSMANTAVEDEKIVQPLKQLVRVATDADKKVMENNLRLEKDAFRICEEKIAKHQLEMKLVTVEYTFDHSKILFYFSADGRVDFRELVKDLATVFRTRIELRQIGVRDEAKMIGGLGICGCPLCCSTFLENFQPVSINMAKDQGLSLNPTKISGACGRLMCCLKYENEAYQDMLRQTPPNESLVDTPYGRGTVMDSSLLRGTCRVRMQGNPDAPVTVPCCQCTTLRRGKDKGEPLDLPPEPPVTAVPPMQGKAPAPAAAQSAPQGDRPAPERRRNRPDRPRNGGDRKPRPDRPDRGERVERGERPDRPEKTDRPERPEKPDRPPRPPKPRDNGGRPPRPKNDGSQKPAPASGEGTPRPAPGGDRPAPAGGPPRRRNGHRGGKRGPRPAGAPPAGSNAE